MTSVSSRPVGIIANNLIPYLQRIGADLADGVLTHACLSAEEYADEVVHGPLTEARSALEAGHAAKATGLLTKALDDIVADLRDGTVSVSATGQISAQDLAIKLAALLPLAPASAP